MKNFRFKTINFLLIFVISLTFSACGIYYTNNQTGLSQTNQTKSFSVTFIYNNGDANSKVFVEEGKMVTMPNEPLKTNYLFTGWYLDTNLTTRYDFSKKVYKAFSLYAGYVLDAVTLTNKISTNIIKSVVKVYNKNYNMSWGFEVSSFTSQGSGFCFHIQDGYYYVLTNCHVAFDDPYYDYQTFTIEDYQGKTYQGFLYKNPNKSSSAIMASYDLACLYFRSSSTNVNKLSIVSKNPGYNEDVVSLGAPKDQSNFITYGKIQEYKKITLTDTSVSKSNVTFDVICHDAFINNGSSGGPLLNSNLDVVGLNYAASPTSEDSFSIPAEKIKEFLYNYVYN